MPTHFDIIGNVRITQGQLSGDTFSIFRGGNAVVAVDLNVTVENDILLFGTIRGEQGVDLSFKSRNGNILVFGEISTEKGANGSKPAEAGKDGGSIRLEAPNGDITISGRIKTGDGGIGASAIDYPSKAQTESGIGGKGGSITVSAENLSLKSAKIESGKGGNGGFAEADGWDNDAMLAWITEHMDEIFQPMEPLGPGIDMEPAIPMFPPVDEIAENSVLAKSGIGGDGGRILLTANLLGFVTPGTELKSGDGGKSSTARAVRAKSGIAVSGLPGNGGAIDFAGQNAVWTGNGSDLLGTGASFTGIKLEPGTGGESGYGVAINLSTSSATASKGGEGGKASTGQKGNGGNSGKAIASTNNPVCSDVDGPGTGSQQGPGAESRANCP